MPSVCRRCCCTIRSGQQVLMCCKCCDLVHVRCLPVSWEEAQQLSCQPQWECMDCTAKSAEELERQLLKYAREQWLNERLDDLLSRVMTIQQEQDEVIKYVSECSTSLVDDFKDMDELEKTVEDLHVLGSKNCLESELGGTLLDYECIHLDPEDPPLDSPLSTGRRRSSDGHRKQRSMVLHNLGSTGSHRTNSSKTQRIPKMSLSLGVLISQLIITECN